MLCRTLSEVEPILFSIRGRGGYSFAHFISFLNFGGIIVLAVFFFFLDWGGGGGGEKAIFEDFFQRHLFSPRNYQF